MSDTRHRMKRATHVLAAVVVALVINAMLFVTLESLNRAANAEGVRRAELTVVRLMPPQLSAPRPPEPPKPKPSKPEPMEVSLDVRFEPTQADVSEVAQTPLDVSPPTVAPVRVAVARPSIAPPAPVEAAPAPRPTAPSAPRNAEDIDQPPSELATPDIQYPRAALRRRQSGSVTLRLLINERGRVEDMRVVNVVGSDAFRDAVTRNMSAWRFTVPKDDGVPVKVWATKTITFEPRAE
ncbi:MAG: TonB family protein [Phycisphaera sp.]|nr:TonB family protein [Phycisphaera sp.]